MLLKAELLFQLVPNSGKYEYIGEYPLQVGLRRIEPKQLVDLEEVGLQYTPEDKRMLRVDFAGWAYHLRSIVKK